MNPYRKLLLTIAFVCSALFCAHGQSYFRSVASGNWNATSTWESSPNNITWTPAVSTPSSTELAITIQSPNSVTINTTITIDEVTVNLGSTLIITGAITLTINNGIGIDLINNGTINDNLTTVGGSIAFPGGAKWSMSSGATLLKTTGSANNTWQTAYQGGIATIPATSNWILRRTAGGNPPISTTVAGGAYYPNLIIENALAGTWVTTAGSTFTGSTGYPIIKGNFDLGGTGIGTVDFLNAQTNASPTRIIGNLLIRTGNIFRNQGTGIQLESNLTVNGTLNYSGTSKVLFAGNIAQTVVSAPGSIAIYNLEINKPLNDVTINKAFTVDNNVNFIQGKFNTTTATPITFGALATATNYSNTSFINGPCLKSGTNGFTFPVGKGNNVQPLGMNAGAVGITPPFWTEGFVSGAGWTLANVLGPEGSDPNPFYIGAWEGGGIAPGGCGVANNGNNTLHVGSVFNPTGGAAYDAGGLCGLLYCPQTNRRAQSPVINCTGYSSIVLSFNYLENGSGVLDNMTLWYYDGSAWTQIADPPKTLCCGGVACTGFNQGQWTAYSIALPASANNNPNVRIGFQWQNNDDGVGTDPSFAVDDIALTSIVPEIFSAEYFPVNPQSLFGNNLEPTLDHISYCEYWDFSRLSGSTNRQVTLTWDNASCGVTSMNDLRVARYDAGANIWRDHGNNTPLLTGNTSAGTITSSLISTAFCPYTLASVNALNPLPVSFINYELKEVNNHANIYWKTATEPLNSFFTVEKTTNQFDVTQVATIAGKGDANSGAVYIVADPQPLASGLSYYRIKQTDVNGQSNFTIWKSLSKEIKSEQQLNVISDQFGIYFSVSDFNSKTATSVFIFNSLGKLVFSQTANLTENNHLNIQLPSGIYLLSVNLPTGIITKKFRFGVN